MRPIDADAIRYDQLLKIGDKKHPLEWAASQSSINSTPTLKIESIKHGYWIDCGWSIRCSECGHNMPFSTRNYCPNCGAKMDGKDSEEQYGNFS